MNIGALLQARCGSSRLANKVILPLPFGGSKCVLEHIAERAKFSKLINRIIVATTTNIEDDEIAHLFPNQTFRGESSDALKRFYSAASKYEFDIIVRLTGDNPCIDPHYIDLSIEALLSNNFDYCRTVGLPIGVNVEVFRYSALELAHKKAATPLDREHITSYMLNTPTGLNVGEVKVTLPECYPDVRLTLDYPSDYAIMSLIFSHFFDIDFSITDVLNLFLKHPWLKDVNKNIQKTAPSKNDEELHTAITLLENAGLIHAAKIFEFYTQKMLSHT